MIGSATCPKCGSDRVGKEKIMGADTGDYVCGSCAYIDCRSEFKNAAKKKEEKNETDH